MNIFRKLLNYIYPNFNPVDTKFIEGNGVTYGLSYQDNDDGISEVQLIISSLYQTNKSVTHNTGIRIPNALKDQLYLSLIADSAETDKIGIIFPEEATNKQGKKHQRLSFNTYEVKHSVNASSVEHLGTTELQKNIKNESSANIGSSYSDPRIVT